MAGISGIAGGGVPATRGPWSPAGRLGGNLPALWLDAGEASSIQTGGSRFHGGAANFQVPHNTDFDIRSDRDLFVSCFFKSTGTGLARTVGVGSAGAGNYAYFIYTGGGSTLQFSTYNSGGGYAKIMAYQSQYVIGTTTWHFMACGYDSANDQLWISLDDYPRQFVSYNGSAFIQPVQPFEIGGVAAGYFIGSLARVGFWHLTPTEAQVIELYNSGQGRTFTELTGDLADTANCKGYWNLNEASGNALDSTSNARDGVEVGTVTTNGGVVTTSRKYIAASTQYHNVACSPDISVGGDGDWCVSSWIYMTSLPAVLYYILGTAPGSTASREFSIYYDDRAGVKGFRVAGGDAANANAYLAAYAMQAEVDVWYHVTAWHDQALEKTYIQVDEETPGSAVSDGTARYEVGGFGIGYLPAVGYYHDGRIARTLLARPPAGTSIADIIDVIKTTLWNDGEGYHSSDITDAQRDAWGVVSIWDGDKTLAGTALVDKVGWRARDLEGSTTSHLSRAVTGGEELGTADFSFAGFVKLESLGNPRLITRYADANNYWLFAIHSSGKLWFYSWIAAGLKHSVLGTTVLEVGRWYHIAMTFDRDTPANNKVYINGQVEATSANTSSTADLSLSGGTLALSANGAAVFDGLMSSMLYLERILTPAEVASLHNGGEPLTPSEMLTAGVDPEECNAYWLLDEITGDSIDYSGNKLHLTDTNTVTSGPGPTKDIVADQTVNGNDGILIGFDSAFGAWQSDSPSVRPGEASIFFDGVDDEIQLPNIGTYPAVTLSAWIKPDTGSAGWIYERNGGAGEADHGIFTSIGTTLAMVQWNTAGGNYRTLSVVASLTENVWQHVSLTMTSAKAELFVDGVSVGSETATSGTWDTASAATSLIGNAASGIGPYEGYIHDLRVYDSVLLPADIILLAAGSNATTAPIGQWIGPNERGVAPARDLAAFNAPSFADGPGDTYSTIVDGDPVCEWKSKEGNEHSFVQDTASKRPTYTITDTDISSRPTIDFDGTDDLLVLGEAVSTASLGTIFIVFYSDTPTATQYTLSSCDGTNVDVRLGMLTPASPTATFRDPGAIQQNSDVADHVHGVGTDISASTPHVMTVQSTGTAYSVRFDGASRAIGVLTGADGGDWFGDCTSLANTVVGALKYSSEANFFDGKITEIIVYDQALSAADVAQVEDYLKSKYLVGP